MLTYCIIVKVTPSYSEGGRAQALCLFVAKFNSGFLRFTPVRPTGRRLIPTRAAVSPSASVRFRRLDFL